MPTKKRATRPKPARRAVEAPTPIGVPDGQSLYVLEVPFSDRATAQRDGAQWDAARRSHVYVGHDLPADLQVFSPARWSWAAFLEHEEAGTKPDPEPGDGSLIPRPHQEEAIRAIAAAYKKRRPGFVLADKVGLGKTLAAVAGVRKAAATGPWKVETVLVVAPLSVIAGWRNTLERHGDGGLQWVLVNYESLKKLLEKPPAALNSKRVKTKNRHHARDGTPLRAFDMIIWDESHRLKNPISQTTAAARQLALRDDRRRGRAAFQIWMSATLGSNPLEVSYLAPTLGARTGKEVVDLKAFGAWCDEQRLGVRRGDYGRWDYEPTPAAVERIQSLLFGGKPAWGLRRVPEDIAGWPSLQRSLLPLELDAHQVRLYKIAWTEFRAQMELAQKGKNPTNGLAAQTRMRQKASLLRAPVVADHCVELTNSGLQPVVSVAWLETLDAIGERIGKKAQVNRIHGSLTPADRERERLAFQAADGPAIMLFTPTEGINLHATEQHGNGVPRVTIVGDPRWSAIQSAQAEGRAHRDGERADAYYCYGAGTIEQRMVATLVDRLAKMSAMHGDSEEKEFEALLASMMETDSPLL